MPKDDEKAVATDNKAADREFERTSRRGFLKSIGMSGVAVASGSVLPALGAPQPADGVKVKTATDGVSSEVGHPIELVVNGVRRQLPVVPNAILLDVLRDTLALNGTKKGCDHGQCGACTVHVNGISVNSCLSLAVMHDGDSVDTVEGLGSPERLHPIQQAFWEHDAYQCGYCTAGQMMSAVSVLKDTKIASDDHSLREAMSGNICRCGAYKNIISAIQSTRGKIGRLN